MAKKVKPTNTSAKKHKGNGMGHKGGKYVEDWISRLPDEILVSILPLLTLKEAARTSVLSTRWKDMWTYITSLNFDGSNILDEIQLENMVLERERPKYVCWVNQVLKSHQGPAIEEFRVRFDICGSPRHDIDNWVKFAIEKKVRRFELDLSQCWGVSQNKCYTFPYLFCIDNHLLSQPLGFARCNSLINLRLMSVNVTGEVIEYLLTNCPLLEQLAVNGSNSLLSLIVGSASLKHLEVSDCDNVKNIEISAKNLMSFMYIGPKINVPFKDVPMLVQLCIGGEYCKPLNRLLELSSSLSQLKSLKLVINHVEGRIDFAELPVFCKLRHLELEVSAYDDKNLLIFTPLIHASPLLSKFTLQISWAAHGIRRKPRRSRTCPHHCLKEVEFVGFVGQTLDVELAMYLIKNAVLLEKITFDTRIPALLGSPFEFEETEERRVARKRAELFRAKLPPTIALKVL